jgi:hypothetical protein
MVGVTVNLDGGSDIRPVCLTSLPSECICEGAVCGADSAELTVQGHVANRPPLHWAVTSSGRGARSHDVRFRATAAISVPGGSWHTRSYRGQVRAASLLSDTVAGSVITTRCV